MELNILKWVVCAIFQERYLKEKPMNTILTTALVQDTLKVPIENVGIEIKKLEKKPLKLSKNCTLTKPFSFVFQINNGSK